MRILHLANRHHDGPSAGHGYWLNHAYKSSCENEGHSFSIVAPQNSLDDQVLPALKLSRNWRQRATVFPSLGLKEDATTLLNLIKEGESFVHVYEGGLRELLLLHQTYRGTGYLKGSFNFNLSDPWEQAAISKNKISLALWTKLGQIIRELSPGVAFTAETFELAKLLEPKLGIPLAEYPLPALTSSSSSIAQDKDVDFFIPILGDEELRFTVSALDHLRSKGVWGSMKVVVQPRWSECFSTHGIKELQSFGANVVSGVVSKFEYESIISRTKVVVLPYLNVDYYKLQSSARMLDSVALGARVIVPNGTVLARKVHEQGWGDVFRIDSPVSLAEAIERVHHISSPVLPELKPLMPINAIAKLKTRTYISSSPRIPTRPTRQRWRVVPTLVSLLFLFSSFRSTVGGLLQFFGVSPSVLKKLREIFSR